VGDDTRDSSVFLLREDVGETYEGVTRRAAEAIGAAECHLALYDPATSEIIAQRPRYTAQVRSIPQFRFKPSPASYRVIETGEPYLCNDPGDDPLYERTVRESGVKSVLTVPVRQGDRILGLLYALNKPGGFRPEDVETLSAMAGAVAVTLENIRLYLDEKDRRVLNEGFREVSRALVTTYSEDLGLSTVLDQIWRVLRYQAALALVLEGDRLRVAASRGGDVGIEVSLAETGELAEMIEERQGRILSDAEALLPRLGLRGAAGQAVGVPLMAKGEALGALVVVSAEQTFAERETRLVGALAEHAALFLEVGAILRRERQARARTSALARVTRLAVTRHDAESLLSAVAPEVLSLSGADQVVLYLSHPRNPVLIPVAASGIHPSDEERVKTYRLDMTQGGALGALVVEGVPLAFEGEACDSLTALAGVLNLLAVPMNSRKGILGAMVFSCTRAHECDPVLVEFLHDVAQQVALGVENARLFAALSQMASTDDLTELANRRRFTETLRTELAHARREGQSFSLLLADVDRLKRINDSHGHAAGDAAIRHVAAALKRARRETDVAARLGGEEFGLILPGTNLPGAVQVAERIRSFLDASEVPGVGTVTVSIGVATCPEDGSDEMVIMRAADDRLYAAKTNGRNQVCYATPTGAPVPLETQSSAEGQDGPLRPSVSRG
jgi:diguanylate cyclase (GGDEF)-like protein